MKNDIDVQNITHNYNICYKTFREIVKNKYFECIYRGKKTIFTYDKFFETGLFVRNNVEIFTLSKNEFFQLLLDVFADFIKDFCQNTRQGQKSVKTFNYCKFKLFSIIFALLFLLFLAIQQTTFIIHNIVVGYFCICVLIKVCFLSYGLLLALKQKKINILEKNINWNNLPTYTILVPMFKETETTILQNIASINALKYPKHKIEVFLVLEENDKQTKEFIRQFELNDAKKNKKTIPDNFTQIWTPNFPPQTKPKACDVAVLFATGENVVIYDAEDIPEQDQLLQVVNGFNTYNNASVIQCNLSWYNCHKNILTELFNIEYNVWFNVLLRAISCKEIAFPLGGTSNHFKFDMLEKSNFWDGYNVTEDLELATILHYNNLELKSINSTTNEWCVETIKSWIKQRTRWLKGYILTSLCTLLRIQNFTKPKTFFFAHILIGFSYLSFLLLPFLMVFVLVLENNLLKDLCIICSILYYTQCIITYYVICKKEFITIRPKTILAFFIYPFYFILHCIACWIALFEIFKKPFYWSKTEHNITPAKK